MRCRRSAIPSREAASPDQAAPIPSSAAAPGDFPDRANKAISAGNASLRAKLNLLGRTVELAETNRDFVLGLPKARSALYGKLRDFLMASVYDFDVRLGLLNDVSKTWSATPRRILLKSK